MNKTREWLTSFNTNSVSIPILQNQKAIKISVTGGKGGVGKTSISLKLAKELAYKGSRVLLIDCDYNLSNTAIKLGLPVNNTFFSLLSSERDFSDCLYQDGNFHLLSACNGSSDLFDTKLKLEEFIIDIINEHESSYDYILLDCPAGLQRESLTLNAYCDERIIVVTPDKASITDSYSLIKILSQKFGIKENHLLVNKMTSHQQYIRVIKTMSETVENFLNCRTQILGGVARLEVSATRFDQNFLARGKNDHHQNFLKIIEKLTEKLSTPVMAVENSFIPPRANTKFTQQNA